MNISNKKNYKKFLCLHTSTLHPFVYSIHLLISHSKELRAKWKLLSICQREYLQRLIVTPAREFDKACANINKRNILLNWYCLQLHANLTSTHCLLYVVAENIGCRKYQRYVILPDQVWNCLCWKMYNSKGRLKYYPC